VSLQLAHELTLNFCTAYVFFTNEMRPKVLQEYPGIKFVELGKVLGERWRALTPEEKKRYEEMASDDKVRFQLEMQQYTATQAAAAPPPPPDHAYYHDHNAGTISYDAYAQHELAAHHDPYGQHHTHYHA
jgi:HMG (high mobility group) box